MKRISTIIKTILFAALVFVVLQGCNTNTTNENPIPADGFNINLSSTSYGVARLNYNSQNRVFIVDNDSIEFSTAYYEGNLGGLGHEIRIVPLSNVIMNM